VSKAGKVVLNAVSIMTFIYSIQWKILVTLKKEKPPTNLEEFIHGVLRVGQRPMVTKDSGQIMHLVINIYKT